MMEADVGTEDGAKQLANAIAARFGTIDYAVSAFGGWWQKGVSCYRVHWLTEPAPWVAGHKSELHV